MLLGADAISLFPTTVNDSQGYLIQLENVRLMRSVLTSCYIFFGCTDEGRNLNIDNRFPNVCSIIANAGVVVKSDYYDLTTQD